MKTFRVTYDFSKYRPVWNKSFIDTFGEKNQGFLVTGTDEKQAIEAWNNSQKPGNRLNPFYLKIEEVRP